MNRFLIPVLCIASSFMLGRSTADIEFGNLPFPSIIATQPPLASDKPRVLWLYETDDKVELPRGHRSIIDSQPFRAWMREQGFEFRYLDPQAEQGTDEAWWYQARDLREGDRWLYVVNGNKFYAGEWPADVDAAKALIGGLQ